MKKNLTIIFILFFAAAAFPQDDWNLIWSLHQKPFQIPEIGSEMAIVKAGFDTDGDGLGEFLCAWTDLPDNYLLMYEAVSNDSFALVWYWKYPIPANSFAGIAVGDIDNNGIVDIITTMPSTTATDPNPPRLWVFEWNGVQGENKYGIYSDDTTFTPVNEWNFDVPDNTDFRPYSLTIEDIDNDGKNELVAGVRAGGRGGEVIVASVSGELSGFGGWEIEYNLQNLTGGSLYNVTTGDLDNDGNKEIYAFVWDLFSLHIIECTGSNQYQVVNSMSEVFASTGIDYGALDAVRVADVNSDGVNELYIASTEPQNQMFIITDITDVSAITSADIKPFFQIPVNDEGKLRSMWIADPDHDQKMDLMIGGETNGQIFDMEYKGSGDPADSSNWEVNVLFDIFEYSGFAPTATPTIDPRLFYGSPAGDMDGDGKDEYVFVNYRSSFAVWPEDGYVWMIEIDQATDINDDASIISDFKLRQNYPNPFNPVTTIDYSVPKASNIKISIINSLGQEVQTLVNDFKETGNYSVRFNAANLASGVYLYQLKAGDFVTTKKMILMK